MDSKPPTPILPSLAIENIMEHLELPELLNFRKVSTQCRQMSYNPLRNYFIKDCNKMFKTFYNEDQIKSLLTCNPRLVSCFMHLKFENPLIYTTPSFLRYVEIFSSIKTLHLTVSGETRYKDLLNILNKVKDTLRELQVIESPLSTVVLHNLMSPDNYWRRTTPEEFRRLKRMGDHEKWNFSNLESIEFHVEKKFRRPNNMCPSEELFLLTLLRKCAPGSIKHFILRRTHYVDGSRIEYREYNENDYDRFWEEEEAAVDRPLGSGSLIALTISLLSTIKSLSEVENFFAEGWFPFEENEIIHLNNERGRPLRFKKMEFRIVKGLSNVLSLLPTSTTSLTYLDLRLRFNTSNTSMVETSVRFNLPKLKELIIGDMEEDLGEELVLLNRMPRLQKLIYDGENFDNAFPKQGTPPRQQWCHEKLEHLVIPRSSMNPFIVKETRLLFPNLKILECPQLDDSSLSSVCTYLPSLESLTLGEKITDKGVTGIHWRNFCKAMIQLNNKEPIRREQAYLKKLKNLRELKIFSRYLTDRSIQLGIALCNGLKKLHLPDSHLLTNECFEALSKSGLNLELLVIPRPMDGAIVMNVDKIKQYWESHRNCTIKLSHIQHLPGNRYKRVEKFLHTL